MSTYNFAVARVLGSGIGLIAFASAFTVAFSIASVSCSFATTRRFVPLATVVVTGIFVVCPLRVCARGDHHEQRRRNGSR